MQQERQKSNTLQIKSNHEKMNAVPSMSKNSNGVTILANALRGNSFNHKGDVDHNDVNFSERSDSERMNVESVEYGPDYKF